MLSGNWGTWLAFYTFPTKDPILPWRHSALNSSSPPPSLHLKGSRRFWSCHVLVQPSGVGMGEQSVCIYRNERTEVLLWEQTTSTQSSQESNRDKRFRLNVTRLKKPRYHSLGWAEAEGQIGKLSFRICKGRVLWKRRPVVLRGRPRSILLLKGEYMTSLFHFKQDSQRRVFLETT